jgi:hypothetical protein
MTRLVWLGCAISFIATAAVEFNRDVRPILSERCFTCHGPDASKRPSAFRLDTADGARTPLRKGAVAIQPGSPEESELIRRIKSTNRADRMPPAYAGHDALPPREIATLEQWIREGAPYQGHWSFLPVKRPAARSIDDLVRQHLQPLGLSLSPETDRRTLLRRVTLDLTGLPPTPAEADAFLADLSPNAYEKVVDRLLASPAHAERLAIRWLENARYADTNGYQTDGVRDMWRWRDWVIDAFARNMPFDQFTIEQLAGDLLPNPTLSQRMATAFHRNHRTTAEGGSVEEEFRVEYVADRAETTATVWLGLTMGCARCHDHKYDPITQKDFYSLFAFFNNVPERGLVYNFGNEEPLIKAPTPQHQAELARLDAIVARYQQQWDALEPRLRDAQTKWERRVSRQPAFEWRPTDGQVLHETLDHGAEGRVGQAHAFDGQSAQELDNKVANFGYLDPYSFSVWIRPAADTGTIFSRMEDYREGTGYRLFLENGRVHWVVTLRYTDISLRLETVDTVPLNEWSHLALTYDGRRKGQGVRIYRNGIEQALKITFDELTYPYSTKEPFRIGAGGGLRFTGLIDELRAWNRELTPAEARSLSVFEPVPAVAAKPLRSQPEEDLLRLCYLDRFAPPEVRRAEFELLVARNTRDRYYDQLPTLMVMQEGPHRQAHILKRGAYDAPGDAVDPATPAILPPLPVGEPRNRLALARWLVRRDHPLTARVTVNRYWQMLFGTGLVKTVEDFGSQGEWPQYPDVLDWLAAEFMDSGWNVRHLLKTIVMSGVYRQSSRVTPQLLARDPENRLLARGPRLRLPADAIRDQALAVSGLLVNRLGGPSVKPYQPAGLWQELHGGGGYVPDRGEGLYRRSLYTYWKRTVAPPSMMNFDSPTREVCTVRETRTNTPLQALTLMNEVTYLEAARKLAERMWHAGATPADRVRQGYRLTLAREPQDRELQIVLRSLDGFLTRFAAAPAQADAYLKTGESPRDAAIPASQLAAYASIASLLLNLDETITKE